MKKHVHIQHACIRVELLLIQADTPLCEYKSYILS